MDAVAEDGELTSPAVGDDYEALFRATYARLVIALSLGTTDQPATEPTTGGT